MSLRTFMGRWEGQARLMLNYGLSSEQAERALELCLQFDRAPDFIIRQPERGGQGAGPPYLLRWYVWPRNRWLNVYHHLFLASDPGRAPHDHPWVSRSRVLAGGYEEELADGSYVQRRQGDVIWRGPWSPHRVILRPGQEFAETRFVTGPRLRGWGFHCPQGWVPFDVHQANGHEC